jgi:hypothetical protein
MRIPFEQKKRENLEQRYAKLVEDWEAAANQQLRVCDDAENLRLQRQCEHLEAEIQKVEAQLDELEAAAKSGPQRADEMRARLSQIDFERALDVFQQTLAPFADREGAALFLLQQYAPMGGEWLLERLKQELQNRGNLKPYPVRISEEIRPDEFGLLERLAGHLGLCLEAGDWRGCTAQVVEKLCASVRTNDIVLIELHQWECLARQARTLQRFVSDFWTPLLEQMPRIAEDFEGFKLIVVITINGQLPADERTRELVGPAERAAPDTVRELPLTCWEPRHIRKLCRHSGRSRAEIARMVPQIYERSSRGVPRIVYSEVMRWLERRT